MSPSTFYRPILCTARSFNYPNDSNIARANYYFLRELFEILKCANLIEGANYY